MQQTDRGNYRTQESFAHEFRHSCLGKILILAVFIGALMVIGHLTVPDEETMMTEMTDNIRQCIADNDSIKTDWIDDCVNNVGYIFTDADSVINEEVYQNFLKYNELGYYRHWFYATTLLHNNFRPEGTRVGVGIFGLVIPTMSFDEFLFRIGPMHKGYDQKPVRATIIKGGESFGSDPELGL